MNGTVPLRMFPAFAVDVPSTMLPAGVTWASIAPMRVSLSFTAVLTVLKLPFTSDALACVPPVKVVSCPTGPAWLQRLGRASNDNAKMIRFAFMMWLSRLSLARDLLRPAREKLPQLFDAVKAPSPAALGFLDDAVEREAVVVAPRRRVPLRLASIDAHDVVLAAHGKENIPRQVTAGIQRGSEAIQVLRREVRRASVLGE